MPLKYLWTVIYKDGSVMGQSSNDLSRTDSSRSAFFDIQQDRVKCFILKGVKHTYSVDLIDGHFEVNGVPFRFHERLVKLTNIRLIFFRRHTHTFIGDDSEHITYRFGWQANDPTGANVQRVMEID